MPRARGTRNQLGRRNLTPESVAYLRGKLYREAEKNPGERTDLLPEKLSGGDTAAQFAERFKVTDRTIRNDAKFSEQLDELAEELGDEFRADPGCLELAHPELADRRNGRRFPA